MIPAGIVRESEIKAAVEDVERTLSPRVKYIRYNIDRDWSGDWGVFFKVLLSDEANNIRNLRDPTSLENLHEITRRVERELEDRLDFSALELFAYYNYRLESEQKMLLDKAWA